MDLLRLLVQAGNNSELRRLLFSNFSLLLSFLNVDATTCTPRRSSDTENWQNEYFPGGGSGTGSASGGGGGRRLYFAAPVARLMAAVVDGDDALVKSVSDEHLTQLARGASRSRRGRGVAFLLWAPFRPLRVRGDLRACVIPLYCCFVGFGAAPPDVACSLCWCFRWYTMEIESWLGFKTGTSAICKLHLSARPDMTAYAPRIRRRVLLIRQGVRSPDSPANVRDVQRQTGSCHATACACETNPPVYARELCS